MDSSWDIALLCTLCVILLNISSLTTAEESKVVMENTSTIVGQISRQHRAVPMDDHTLDDNCREVALAAMREWAQSGLTASDLRVKRMTDGVTNKIVKVSTPKGWPEFATTNEVLVRVFGIGTENFINRGTELVFWQYLSKNKLAARVYGLFDNGLITGFLPGRTISAEEIREPSFQKLIADAMAGLHTLPLSKTLLEEINERMDLPKDAEMKASLWDTIEKFLKGVDWSKIPKEKLELLKTHKCSEADIRREVAEIQAHIKEKKMEGPLVLSHNDINQVNVIFGSTLNKLSGEKTDKITLIDYEYATFNPRGFDLGNHICEYMGLPVVDPNRYPEKDTQMPFFRAYVQAIHRRTHENELNEIHKQEILKYDEENQYEPPQPDNEASGFLDGEASDEELPDLSLSPELPEIVVEDLPADSIEEEAQALYVEAQKYALVSHLFWGSWTILQSQQSDIDWDFFEYALIRFGRYYQDRDLFLAL